MPVPLDYPCIRRMSTIAVPKQDILFDTYDFQKYKPENNIDTTLEPRQLEADYCRDFACCGLVLNDLHDLLQHCEECHIHGEVDLGDEEKEHDRNGALWPCPSPVSIDQATCMSSSSSSSSDTAPTLDATHKKIKTDFANIYIPHGSNQMEPIDLTWPDASSWEPLPLSTSTPYNDDKVVCGKKRTFEQSTSSACAMDLVPLTTAKNLILPAGGESDGEFLTRANALLASVDTNCDYSYKRYKCLSQGCDKAYKNYNGLKYHKEHGHCSSGVGKNVPKPYQCTIGDCGKRYKNLNGLKYHIEHSHMAALNQILATSGHALSSVPATAAPFLDPIDTFA